MTVTVVVYTDDTGATVEGLEGGPDDNLAEWKIVNGIPVKLTPAELAIKVSNAKIYEDIRALEDSIDTKRRRREYGEYLRKKLSGISPSQDEVATANLVSGVHAQISALRGKLY